jgi:hypothetical protein
MWRTGIQFATPVRHAGVASIRLSAPGSTQSADAFKPTTNGSPLNRKVNATLAQNDYSPGDSGGRFLRERLVPATLCVDRTDGISEGHKTTVQNGENRLSDRRSRVSLLMRVAKSSCFRNMPQRILRCSVWMIHRNCLSFCSRMMDLKSRWSQLPASQRMPAERGYDRYTNPQAFTVRRLAKSITASEIPSAASTVTTDDLRPMFHTLSDFRREGAMSVLLTSTWVEPVSPSSSVPVCSRSVSCSFPYPSYRLCRPFHHPLLLRVVAQKSSVERG